jgi:hypothetical protein
VPQQQLDGNLMVTTYSSGLNDIEVILYTVKGGTHALHFPTIDLIWRFFELHLIQVCFTRNFSFCWHNILLLFFVDRVIKNR